MSRPKISIIIPSLYYKRPVNKRYIYKKRYTLSDVLKDLQANVSLPVEVISICNNNKDKDLIDLVSKHRRVDKFIINSHNPGVSRSWNMGAMMAEGEALCFLNDDVHIGKGALEELYQVLFSEEKIGLVGPAGTLYDKATPGLYVGQDNQEEADAIVGYLFIIKKNLFHQIGGFDIEYSPASFEEIDIGKSIQKNNHKCVVIPRLDVKHHHCHGVSTKKQVIKYLNKEISTEDLFHKNKRYFLDKWYSNKHS